MKSSQHDAEQPPAETARTLAEWKKPLLVTFTFLAFITTAFASYTYVYFNRLNQGMDTDEALSNEVLDSAILTFETETIDDRDNQKVNQCDESSYRSWEMFNISETSLIYRLDPIENIFYLKRPQGRELIVNALVCDELKTFGQKLFFKIFEELQVTFDFHRADELTGRLTGMINMKKLYNRDYVWTWSTFDTERYFVSLEDSVLSYVVSSTHTLIDTSKEELLNTKTIQFECPGVEVSKEFKSVEMGWMAVGPTTYPEQHAENLLQLSGVFQANNVWRTLADDCIAKYVNSIRNLEIKSYCSCNTSKVNCTNDNCNKIWEWPKKRSIGFKIWYQNNQWTLAYRYDDPKESDEIQLN
ncbi:uncharacterized protein LOC109409857 [Aedes albopictus]|uniref:Uncharacterized protein n=1 Tax=Aedes albopictus TaxID=7160 RepID=A0ABM1Y606_AEDAL